MKVGTEVLFIFYKDNDNETEIFVLHKDKIILKQCRLAYIKYLCKNQNVNYSKCCNIYRTFLNVIGK